MFLYTVVEVEVDVVVVVEVVVVVVVVVEVVVVVVDVVLVGLVVVVEVVLVVDVYGDKYIISGPPIICCKNYFSFQTKIILSAKCICLVSVNLSFSSII